MMKFEGNFIIFWKEIGW